MKKNAVSKPAGKTNSILGIKSLFMMFCISSSLCAEPLDLLEDELDESPLEIIPGKELAALDTSSFIQESTTQQEIQLPAPVFKLPSCKSSFLAVGLSSIMPGLGHVYLGDMKTAGGLIGSAGLGCTVASLSSSDQFVQSTSFLAVETTWLYGIYAAYRDVRINNGQIGYSYKMPTDSFLELSAAPFSFSVLKKPEVWGGVLGSLAIAFAAVYVAFPEERHIHPSFSLKKTLAPLAAFPIGVGEESFFRGFLQSQFSEWCTPWGGIVLSSLVFGLAHVPNAWDLEPQERRGYYTIVVPLIAASGIYDGWLAYKNHSLKESVAIHTWYDFVLFTMGSLASQAAIRGRSEFAVAIAF
jgi:membrane protease YdiL (CAAX protease family)